MKQVAAWALVCCALAARADDDAALALADSAVPAVAPKRDWQGWVEAGTGVTWLQEPAATAGFGRLALDLSVDTRLAPRWRLAAASRLDLRHDEGGADTSVNTLKELWLGYRPSASTLIDGGRINVHQGVAMGYNPTDFLRPRVVRALVSIDPEVVRQNRLGTVMLRGQHVWDTGSFSALMAPRLGSGRSDHAASPDWGRSNDRARAQMQFSPRLAPQWSPELLLYIEDGAAPHVGLNQSVLVNTATTLHAEWSGGRDVTLLQAAQGRSAPRAFRSRLAAGGAWTAPGGGTLTLEYHYNQAAPGTAELEQLRASSPILWQTWRLYALDTQDAPTRRALFLHYRQPDSGMAGLELAAMCRLDLQDRSALHWLQLRYVQPRWDVAMQLQLRSGADDTVWGGTRQRGAAELVWRWFL